MVPIEKFEKREFDVSVISIMFDLVLYLNKYIKEIL
jgi:hypothetical protein